MRPWAKIVLTLLLGLIVGGGVWGYTLFFKKTKAGLLIETTPVSRVFIDGQEVGKTRFDITTEAREITLKLVPISDRELPTFETKLTLVSGVKTVYQRTFASDVDSASDILISYEKTGLQTAGISVVTTPENALLILDNKETGNTPIKLDNIKEGEHTLTLTAMGYRDRTTDVRNKKGYKLTVATTLSKDEAFQQEAPSQSDLPSPSPTPAETILILDTPTGYLRVRAEPSTLGEEVGQVTPGQAYELLESDDKTGWYKIRFDGKEGWVSNKYATIGTPLPELSPASSPSPSPIEG